MSDIMMSPELTDIIDLNDSIKQNISCEVSFTDSVLGGKFHKFLVKRDDVGKISLIDVCLKIEDQKALDAISRIASDFIRKIELYSDTNKVFSYSINNNTNTTFQSCCALNIENGEYILQVTLTVSHV